MTADETATPRFSSATESPAKLLARVRERLTREAARAPLADPVATAPREGPLDFESGRGLLHGWYPPEPFGDFTFRWTERRFAFEADVDAATHLRMEACLFPESGLQELRLRLRVDDRDAGTACIREGWNPVFFTLPEGSTGRARFALDSGGSWRPAETGASPDGRELSLAVRRLELVGLASLPRVSLSPAAVRPFEPSAGPVARGGVLFRAARAMRRLLFGSDLTHRVERAAEENAHLANRLAELEARLAEHARRYNEAASRLEESLRALASEDARLRDEIGAAAAQARVELGRKIGGLGGV